MIDIVDKNELVSLTELCRSWGVTATTGKHWLNKGWITPLRINDSGVHTRYYFAPDTPRPPQYKPKPPQKSKYDVTPEMLDELETTGDTELSKKYDIPHHVFRHLRQIHNKGLVHNTYSDEELIDKIKELVPLLGYKKELVSKINEGDKKASKVQIQTVYKYLVDNKQIKPFTGQAKPKMIDGKPYVSLSSIDWGITRQAKHSLWKGGWIPEGRISNGVVYVPANLKKPTNDRKKAVI